MMGRGPRMGFVELPRQSRIFRCTEGGDHLVEVQCASQYAAYWRMRRIGEVKWVRRRASDFLRSHTEVVCRGTVSGLR